MTQPAVIVIDTGDQPSLAALALQRDPANVLLWAPAWDEPDVRGHCVDQHQQTFETAGLIVGAAAGPGVIGQARMLLEVCEVASANDCATIVWPVMRGPELARGRPILDLVSHIGAVSGLEGGPEIVIETPMLDVTEMQVVELIIAQGVPISLAWPFIGSSAGPQDEGSHRWAEALARLGLAWPGQQPVATSI